MKKGLIAGARAEFKWGQNDEIILRRPNALHYNCRNQLSGIAGTQTQAPALLCQRIANWESHDVEHEWAEECLGAGHGTAGRDGYGCRRSVYR